MGVGGEIALGVGSRARALSQHVEGIAHRALRPGALERVLDRLSEHEVRGEEPHRLARGCPHCRKAETLEETLQNRVRGLPGVDDASGDAQGPGRGCDQKRVRFDAVGRPIAGRELVLDQPVGGGGIRHAQEGLRQHHESQPLLGGQRIGMEEILDSAEPACVAADPFNEAGRICVNSPFGIGPGAGLFQQPGRDRLVGRRVGSGKDDAFPCIRGPGTFRILGHVQAWACVR